MGKKEKKDTETILPTFPTYSSETSLCKFNFSLKCFRGKKVNIFRQSVMHGVQKSALEVRYQTMGTPPLRDPNTTLILLKIV